nr:ATP-binding protein [Streptomyces sp. HNM0575]
MTAFLTAVGNGAAGEMGKHILLSTGAQVRRCLGRETPLPDTTEGWEILARQVHRRLSEDPRQNTEFTHLMRSMSDAAPTLRPGPGLPPAPRDFTDRARVVKLLRREATRPAAGRPRAALLYGRPGMGTSAVALHWGSLCIDRFPDGQFYIDLRGAAGELGPDPATVLQLLLQQMDVDPEQMPSTETGREALYRSLTAGRRALIVVDHATTAAQVRALIPSAPEVFLLVVSSGPAFTLEAELIEVPKLEERDAKRMLKKVATRYGVSWPAAEVSGTVARCEGNAFALQAAAMRLLAGDPTLPSSVDGATANDPVRAVTRDAVHRLGPDAARLCRLAALGGWPSVDATLGGRAADVTPQEAGRMLAKAAEVQLMERLGDGRYRFRPEVRRHLEDEAGPEHGIPECSAAVSRVLGELLERALHAACAALPKSWRVVELAPAEGSPYRDEAEGMAALLADLGNLVRAVSVAEEYQQYGTVLRLARALWPLQLKAGRWDELLPALRLAARCADEHQSSSRMAGALHFQLAHCLGELRRGEEAEQQARDAVACERAAGHVRGEASSVELLGLLHLNQWKYPAAYEQFIEAERIYRSITPGQKGVDDLPRALTLAERHQARALRGLGRLEESRSRLESVQDWFAAQGEAYNQARALTDLADTLHEAGDNSAALAKITVAERLLAPEKAAPHLAYLTGLRERCEAAI